MISKVNFNRPSFGVVSKRAASIAINATDGDLNNLQKVAELVKEQNEFVTDYAIMGGDTGRSFSIYSIDDGKIGERLDTDFYGFEDVCNFAKKLQIKLNNIPAFKKLRKEIIDDCEIFFGREQD